MGFWVHSESRAYDLLLSISLNMYLAQKEAWERRAERDAGRAAQHCGHTDGETSTLKIHSLLHKSGAGSNAVFGKRIRILILWLKLI